MAATFFCGRFILSSNLDHQFQSARIIENLGLTLRDKYNFVNSPCNVKVNRLAQCLYHFAKTYADGKSCRIDDFVQIKETITGSKEALVELETQHRSIMLYLWLGNRYPDCFGEVEYAHVLKNNCETAIQSNLFLLHGNKKMRKRLRSQFISKNEDLQGY